MHIRFLGYRKIYFSFSALVVAASIVVLVFFGLKPGIDFTGGSILEIAYQEERPSQEEIAQQLSELELGTVYVQPTGEKGVIIRMRDVDEETHQRILQQLLQGERVVEERRFESVGPVIGKELKRKTAIVTLLVLLSIVVYIAFAFKRVQRPLRSWQYGIASVLALFHDILVPLGIFAVLGKVYGIEISIPVVTALLAVMGYSINNTVVVFDRIRENLFRKEGMSFEEVVEGSINQTLARQISTSTTTLFVALAIFFFGGETLKYFALALSLGIIAGTYSSIFLAGPFLVAWFRWKHRGA